MSRRHVIALTAWGLALALAILSGCGGTSRKSKATAKGTDAATPNDKAAEPQLVFDLAFNEGKLVAELPPGRPTATAERRGTALTLSFAGLDTVNDAANFVAGEGDGKGHFYQVWLRESPHAEPTSLGAIEVDEQGAATLTADLAALELQPAAEPAVLLSLEADDGRPGIGADILFEDVCPADGESGPLAFALPAQAEAFDAEVNVRGAAIGIDVMVAELAAADEEAEQSDPFMPSPAEPTEEAEATEPPTPLCRYHAWAWDKESRRSFALGDAALERSDPKDVATAAITGTLDNLSAGKLKWADVEAVYVTWQPPGLTGPGRVRPLVGRIPFALAFNEGRLEPKRTLELPGGEMSIAGSSLTLSLTHLDPINDPQSFVVGDGDGTGLFYQAWAIDTEAPAQTSLGALSVDPRGTAQATIDLASLGLQTADLEAVTVTLEEDDDDAGPNELGLLKGAFPTEGSPTRLTFATVPAAGEYRGYGRVDGSVVTLGVHVPPLPGPKGPSLTDPTPHTAPGHKADQSRGGSFRYEGWLADADSDKTVSLGVLAIREGLGGTHKARAVTDVAVAAAAVGLKPAEFDFLMVTLEPPHGDPQPSARCVLIGRVPSAVPPPQVAQAAEPAGESTEPAKAPAEAPAD